MVLLSGGLSQIYGGLPGAETILPDELYNIASQEVVEVLDLQQSLGRTQHATIKIGDRILAFGGRNSNNTAPSKISEFNTFSNSWTDLNQELLSINTSELVVAPFPVSSLDCVPQCRCGIDNGKERIFGGSEAAVGEKHQLSVKNPFQADSYPWIGALLQDEDIDADFINSKCSAVLV